MKHFVIYIVFVFLALSSLKAQGDYRTFKLDAGVLMGEVNHYHIGLFAPYFEPKININNNLTLGLRLEYVFYSKSDFIVFNPNDPYYSGLHSDGWTFSTVFTSDYYFNDHYVRPFIGCGAGAFYMYNKKANSYLDFNEEVIALGVVPRLGVIIGQFRVSCEYNFIFSDKTNLDYLSLKLGFEIGGKKKWF